MDATSSGPDRPSHRTRWLVPVVAVVALLVAGAVFVLVRDSGSAAAAAVLEPAARSGADPFTQSVAVGPVAEFPSEVVAVSVATREALPTDDETHVLVAEGNTPGLYGGTGDAKACDPAQLVSFLAGDPAKAKAWAGVLGISPDGIGAYVATLTPVVLTSDTVVTNHGFRNGAATPVQSVLQAGTAVMVDPTGTPRVKCNCGNPLGPPAATPLGTPSGSPWPGYAPAAVVAVRPSEPAKTLAVTDITTGAQEIIELGSQLADRPSPTSTTTSTTTTTTTRSTSRSSGLDGDYDVRFGTAGSVTVHASVTTYTVSVKEPFKLEGATCELPATTVLAVFAGTGSHLQGRSSRFDPEDCTYDDAPSSTVDVADDGSLTITSSSGPHVFVKTADGVVVRPVLAGDYRVRYGSEGAATIHDSDGTATISVRSPFRIEGASCTLAASTVIATLQGDGPHFGGRHSRFDPTACTYDDAPSLDADLNTDGTLTVTSSTGPHLFTKI